MSTEERDELGFPVDEPADQPVGEPVDESAEDADYPPREEEQTLMQMMGAPDRPNESTRNTVLWLSLAFASVLFVLTCGVIMVAGWDILTIVTGAILAVVIWAMIGALRYKGEDPMAQFDPPPKPKRGLFGGKKKDESP